MTIFSNLVVVVEVVVYYSIVCKLKGLKKDIYNIGIIYIQNFKIFIFYSKISNLLFSRIFT